MGSKGSQTSTTNQSQNSTYVPAGGGYIAGALNNATALNNKGTPTIPTAPVAGFSQDQQTAFQNVNNAQGMAQPYINQAQQYFSPQGAQQFLNPYASNVMAGMQDVFGQQNAQNTGSLTQSAGGVGADRIAVGQGELAKQQGLAAGQTLSGLYSNSVQQAQGAGYGTAALGSQAQNAALQGAQAQLGSGGLQQQLSQAQLNAPYQQQLAQQALPYQLGQWYSGQVGSLAPALGGSTYGTGTGTTTSQYNPSVFSQIAGLGLLGGGILGKGSGGAVPYARGGNVNPYAFDDGGAAPIDVSSGLFGGKKLFRLPDQSLPPAQTHVPSLGLNMNMQQPNMAQQGLDMKNMQALGKSIGSGYNNSTSNLFGMSNASQDSLQDAGMLARGGAANPYGLPAFDGGGGAGGDGGDGGGDGGVGSGGGGIGSDAGAIGGDGGMGGSVGAGASGIGSDPGAVGDANAASMGFGNFGSVSGGFGVAADAAAAQAAQSGMATGLGPDDATLGFSPSSMTSNMQAPGSIGDTGSMAGFGPDSISGPTGIGTGYGTAAEGLGMSNMTGFNPSQENLDAAFTSLADNPVGINQSVAQTTPSFTSPTVAGEFGALTGPNVSPAIGQAANATTPGTPGAAPGALSAAISGIPSALSNAASSINGTMGQGLSALSGLVGDQSAPAQAAAAQGSLGGLGGYGGGGYGSGSPYGYRRAQPVGYPMAPVQGYDRGGAANPYHFADSGVVPDDSGDASPLDDAQWPYGPVGASSQDGGLGTVGRAYQQLAGMGLQRGQIDAATQKAGPAAEAAMNTKPLHDAIAGLESSGSPNNGPAGGYANYRYQQFPGFVKQYGAGEQGIDNYARQVLKANPKATFGDLYGGYVTGTGDPATARMQNLLTTTQPGAQGAYANLTKNSKIDPKTPLASLIGGGAQGDAQGNTALGYAEDASGNPSGNPYAAPASNAAPESNPALGYAAAATPPPAGQTGNQGYFSKLFHDPARMALISAGLGAFTPQGIAGGLQQGMQFVQHQQSYDLQAKKLEQEANFHQDQFTKSTPYQQFEMKKPQAIGRNLYGQPVMGVLDQATGAWVDPTTHKPVDVSQMGDASEEQIGSMAKAIANYDQPPPSPFKAFTPVGMAVMAKAREINSQYDAKNYDEAKSAKVKFGAGPQGDAVRSFGTAYRHIDLAEKLIDAMGNGDSKLVNSIKNEWKTVFGTSAAPNNFESAKAIVSDEIIKAVLGSRGALGDRADAQAKLDGATSPKLLHSVIHDVYKPLMIGQLQGYKQQYESATHGAKDFGEKLSPEVSQDLDQAVAASAAKTQQGATPAAAAPAGGGAAAPPAGAVAHLKAHPELRGDFDAKFGQGAAARVLGQ